MEAEGFDKVTSSMIAERSGNTGVQVRQDFFSCGGAPKHEISELEFWLEEKLGFQKKHSELRRITKLKASGILLPLVLKTRKRPG